MGERICALFCVPPISIARLGGSTAPVSAYAWANPANPRTDGQTVVAPAWSLGIGPDGVQAPFMPESIGFRDGALLRPVCPFIEIWARVGDPDAAPATWRDARLTPALLAAEGRSLNDLSVSVVARNLKIQRRTGRRELAYGNFDPSARRPARAVRGAVGLGGECGGCPPAVHPGRWTILRAAAGHGGECR